MRFASTIWRMFHRSRISGITQAGEASIISPRTNLTFHMVLRASTRATQLMVRGRHDQMDLIGLGPGDEMLEFLQLLVAGGASPGRVQQDQIHVFVLG